jgi:ATP-dependent Clp protease ATP-binding subunit ClpC
MKISDEFDTIVGFAREEAMRTGSYSIDADHLFLGILRHGSNPAVETLRSLGVDVASCKAEIDSMIFHEHSIPFGSEDDIRLGREGSNTVSLAIAEAIAEGADEAGAMHILKAVCKQEKSRSSEYLRRRGLCNGIFSKGKPGRSKCSNDISPKELGLLISAIRINPDKTIAS